MSFGKGGCFVMTEAGELIEEGAPVADTTPPPTPAPGQLTMAELDAGIAADIIAALATLTGAQLHELQALETAGKARVTVLDAIATQLALLGL